MVWVWDGLEVYSACGYDILNMNKQWIDALFLADVKILDESKSFVQVSNSLEVCLMEPMGG